MYFWNRTMNGHEFKSILSGKNTLHRKHVDMARKTWPDYITAAFGAENQNACLFVKNLLAIWNHAIRTTRVTIMLLAPMGCLSVWRHGGRVGAPWSAALRPFGGPRRGAPPGIGSWHAAKTWQLRQRNANWTARAAPASGLAPCAKPRVLASSAGSSTSQAPSWLSRTKAPDVSGIIGFVADADTVHRSSCAQGIFEYLAYWSAFCLVFLYVADTWACHRHLGFPSTCRVSGARASTCCWALDIPGTSCLSCTQALAAGTSKYQAPLRLSRTRIILLGPRHRRHHRIRRRHKHLHAHKHEIYTTGTHNICECRPFGGGDPDA